MSADGEPALFTPVISTHPDHGSRVSWAEPAPAWGPAAPQPTRGAQDARAPRYWLAEAERVVLALARSGHTVTSDDLRERYQDEPSATGAAVGALFKRLAGQGQLELVGYRPSTRPQARGRVVGIWQAP